MIPAQAALMFLHGGWHRYAPWWLSCKEFSGAQVGHLSRADWRALSAPLQPLLRHLVVVDTNGHSNSTGGGDDDDGEEPLYDVIQPEKQALTAAYANVGLERQRPQNANQNVLVPLQQVLRARL